MTCTYFWMYMYISFISHVQTLQCLFFTIIYNNLSETDAPKGSVMCPARLGMKSEPGLCIPIHYLLPRLLSHFQLSFSLGLELPKSGTLTAFAVSTGPEVIVLSMVSEEWRSETKSYGSLSWTSPFCLPCLCLPLCAAEDVPPGRC